MPKRLHLSIADESWAAQASGGRITLSDDRPAEDPVEATAGGVTFEVSRAGTRMLVEPSGLTGSAVADGDLVWVTIDGEVFAVRVTRGAARLRSATRDHDAFTPPMPATVVRIAVGPGDRVRDGDVLVALEAMKMELPIRSPRDGVVRAIHCREGDLVQPGDVLLDLDETER